MSVEDLRAAVRAYNLSDKAVEKAELTLAAHRATRATRKRLLAEQVADEAAAGTPQKVIVNVTGYTRERIRQIVNEIRAERAATSEEPP